MIERSPAHKHYASARLRFLKPLLSEYLHRELQYFGPELSELLAEKIVEIFEAVCPSPEHVKPGQVVWNAIHKDTRADWKKRRIVPVVLTLISEEETERLRQGEKPSDVRRDVLARLFKETYEQGGILSTRDAGLLLHISQQTASLIRKQYEDEHQIILPHPGALQDMGSTVSHKSMIVRKVIVQRKDPLVVAGETKHSQRAVDHYLKQYHRVNTLYPINPHPLFIHEVTGLSKSVINEYIKIIKEFSNEE